MEAIAKPRPAAAEAYCSLPPGSAQHRTAHGCWATAGSGARKVVDQKPQKQGWQGLMQVCVCPPLPASWWGQQASGTGRGPRGGRGPEAMWWVPGRGPAAKPGQGAGEDALDVGAGAGLGLQDVAEEVLGDWGVGGEDAGAQHAGGSTAGRRGEGEGRRCSVKCPEVLRGGEH